MKKKDKTQRLSISLLLILLLSSQTLTDSAADAFFTIVWVFFVHAVDIPSTGEYRRRVSFKNTTTGLTHTGGVNVRFERVESRLKLYYYDSQKVGSPGFFMEYFIDDKNIEKSVRAVTDQKA